MTNPITHFIQRVAAIGIVHRSESLMSSWQIILWWEARRILFNFVVGLVGLAAMVLMFACGLLTEKIFGEPIGIPDPPIFAIFAIAAYGVMANVCYTGGWFTELIVRATWGRDIQTFGERAFTLGLMFSVLLTCLPALLVFLVTGVKIVSHFWQRSA